MARDKQHVFSARTTEKGLRLLNQIKAEKGIGWDDLVLDAVCGQYGLDKAVMALPKKEKPAKEEKNGEMSSEQTTEEHSAEEKVPVKKQEKKK